ncbi:hypothetical protein [Ramlibacter albus]|uniref:Uncharacterized protein n=1 Tax=Ramlibacter albus TaxID=2079448 RepID=A0A923S552_9BURK|nr:hypothetical protein [Ramlibacter albus]MBC5767588.1 hypothetical protein [Ramlibacter albus]
MAVSERSADRPETGSPVSGGYLAQLLRDRGYPAPTARMARAYVESLGANGRSELEALMRALSFGTEATSDVTTLLDRINALESSATLAAPSERPVLPLARKPTRRAPDLALLRQHGLHAYAKAGAAKLELDVLQIHGDEPATYTVRLDVAPSRAGSYDWASKIIFQFTLRELPMLGAFLLGYTASKAFSARNHGKGGTKALLIEDQGAHHFLRVNEVGNGQVAMPIAPAEIFGLAQLVLTALALNRPAVPPEATLELLRRVGGSM